MAQYLQRRRRQPLVTNARDLNASFSIEGPPNIAVEPTPTASARASLRLSARLTAGVRCSRNKQAGSVSEYLQGCSRQVEPPHMDI